MIRNGVMDPEKPARSEYLRAWDRLTRFVALRDHSRFELETKLRQRDFSPGVIKRVLTDAEKHGLITSEFAIASRQRELFDRRLKSRRFIEEQLRRRQLPLPAPTEADEELELGKMRELVSRKYGSPDRLSFEERQRAFRFLKYRGFEDRSIQRVLNHEEL